MSEREDVEALAERLFVRLGWSGCAGASWDLTQGACRQKWYDMAKALLPELAAHVEAVRVSERVRLAGEVEALADAYARMAEHRDTHAATRPVLREFADNLRAGLIAAATSPGLRWCEVCHAYGDHKTTRHPDSSEASATQQAARPTAGVRLTEEE